MYYSSTSQHRYCLSFAGNLILDVMSVSMSLLCPCLCPCPSYVRVRVHVLAMWKAHSPLSRHPRCTILPTHCPTLHTAAHTRGGHRVLPLRHNKETSDDAGKSSVTPTGICAHGHSHRCTLWMEWVVTVTVTRWFSVSLVRTGGTGGIRL